MKVPILLIFYLTLIIKCEGFFNRVREAVQEAVHHVAAAPQQVVHAVVQIPQAVEKASNEAVAAVESAAKSAVDTVQEGVDGASSAFESTGEAIQEGLNGAADAIDSAAKSVTDPVEAGWEEISSSFDDGVKSLTENLNPEESFKEAVAAISDGIKFLNHQFKFLEGQIDYVFEDDCYYKCENESEYSPYPNAHFSPDIKGCGAQGFEIPKYVLPNVAMDFCCQQHGQCFGTCGSIKGKCDKQFLLCLLSTCGSSLNLVCHGSATLLYAASRILECENFKGIQRKACRCLNTKCNV